MKRAVLDLHLLVDTAVRAHARPLHPRSPASVRRRDRQASPDRSRAPRRSRSARAVRRCGSCRRSGGSGGAGLRTAAPATVGDELLDLGVEILPLACRAASFARNGPIGSTSFSLWPRGPDSSCATGAAARRLDHGVPGRRFRKHEALGDPLEQLRRPGHRLRAGAQRAPGPRRRPLRRCVHTRVRAEEGRRRSPAELRRALAAAVRRAAAVVPSGSPRSSTSPTAPSVGTVVYGDVDSNVDARPGQGLHRCGARRPSATAAVERVYVTGAAAIQHDLDPVFNSDSATASSRSRCRSRCRAVAVFRLLVGGDRPDRVRRLHDHRHARDRLRRRTAVDDADLRDEPRAADRARDRRRYSLLVVYRFREELAAGKTVEDVVARTMRRQAARSSSRGSPSRSGSRCSSRCRCRSSACSASPGSDPILSILAALTLQPVLLSYYGRRGTARHRIRRGAPVDPEHGLWAAPPRSMPWPGRRSISSRHRGARRCSGARLPLDPGHAGLDVRDPARVAVGPAASTCCN